MASKNVQPDRPDTVRWSEGGPSAPIIIPIVFFVVVGTAFACIFYRYLRKIWTKKRRSDIYEIADAADFALIGEREEKIVNDPPRKQVGVPTLNSVRPFGALVDMEKGYRHYEEDEIEIDHVAETDDAAQEMEMEMDVSHSPNGGVSLRVEVHDSSIDSAAEETTSDDPASNTETLPIRKKRTKRQAPLAATESDV